MYVRMYVCAVLYSLYCRAHASHYSQLSHHTFKTPLHMYVHVCVLYCGVLSLLIIGSCSCMYVRIFFRTNCYLKFASSNTDWVYRYTYIYVLRSFLVKCTNNWHLVIDLFQNQLFLQAYILTYVLYVPCTYVCFLSFTSTDWCISWYCEAWCVQPTGLGQGPPQSAEGTYICTYIRMYVHM